MKRVLVLTLLLSSLAAYAIGLGVVAQASGHRHHHHGHHGHHPSPSPRVTPTPRPTPTPRATPTPTVSPTPFPCPTFSFPSSVTVPVGAAFGITAFPGSGINDSKGSDDSVAVHISNGGLVVDPAGPGCPAGFEYRGGYLALRPGTMTVTAFDSSNPTITQQLAVTVVPDPTVPPPGTCSPFGCVISLGNAWTTMPISVTTLVNLDLPLSSTTPSNAQPVTFQWTVTSVSPTLTLTSSSPDGTFYQYRPTASGSASITVSGTCTSAPCSGTTVTDRWFFQVT